MTQHPEGTPDAKEASALRVVEIDPAVDPRWDEFVAGRPNARVFHHSGWLRSLAVESGQQAIGLACESASGELHGVLPLMRTRGLPFGLGTGAAGARLSSLPNTPAAGPLAVGRPALEVLMRSAVGRARADGVRLQIKAADRALDGLVDGLVGQAWRPNYVVSLPDDLGARRGVTFVTVDNVPSLKGVARAGFLPVAARLVTRRIFRRRVLPAPIPPEVWHYFPRPMA